jgi:flagellar biosynthesis protein FlhG
MQPLEPVPGQARGLRQAKAPPPVRVIAVASGKGGVGKTTVAVNLALALQLAGRRTMLLDADLGLANVDVLLGLSPRYNLSHVLEGRCTLAETILEGPRGLQVVPAASGLARMSQLSPQEHAGLIRAFSELEQPLDVLVVDTAAGIAGDVVTFAQAAQELIVVVCNEPSSITDAYALVKVLSRDHGVERVHILANMVRSALEGREVHDKLLRVAERFLSVSLGYLGAVPHDEWLRRSIQRQSPVLEAYPSCPAATAFRQLARRTEQWALPPGARGNLEFFVERLVTAPPQAGHA